MILDPIGRDAARELARRELDKPIYHRDRPSWLERLWQRFSEWLHELTDRAGAPGAHGNGGGVLSLIVIVVLAAVLIGLVVWVMRGRRNVRSQAEGLLEEGPSTALDHRRAADEHAAAGRWPEAIRERLRAVARDLEERAVLEPRPGRTADELAAEAGAALPDLDDGLREGVRIFDDVWYGDRPGSAEEYGRMTALDDRVRAARPRPLQPAAESEVEALRW
ncbi:DUF4129 domain-containing protein [Actinomadura macrotermitis]|uniref:Protein-glutamine gamma-glutamyltransferase-like C-terminal domain-containing protein n=1 Tax=Actinomadura macrotermitis TaxID=2585200 RepID=A0A7K0C200_9ACTN|nr:hypothetical protein [Actinomadura macrotermitis]